MNIFGEFISVFFAMFTITFMVILSKLAIEALLPNLKKIPSIAKDSFGYVLGKFKKTTKRG